MKNRILKIILVSGIWFFSLFSLPVFATEFITGSYGNDWDSESVDVSVETIDDWSNNAGTSAWYTRDEYYKSSGQSIGDTATGIVTGKQL